MGVQLLQLAPQPRLATTGQQFLAEPAVVRRGLVETARVEAMQQREQRGAHAGDHAELVRLQVAQRIVHGGLGREKAGHARAEHLHQHGAAVGQDLEGVVLFVHDHGDLGAHLALEHRARRQQLDGAVGEGAHQSAQVPHRFRIERLLARDLGYAGAFEERLEQVVAGGGGAW
ncbi:hypothetical protein D9M68_538070 [compost metagenome]